MLFSEPKIPQSTYQTNVVLDSPAFQCSSASRKFLNLELVAKTQHLMRAFQCSSASRKFLNSKPKRALPQASQRFSALQRAENSSMVLASGPVAAVQTVSVLFSEPKIPQSEFGLQLIVSTRSFSALQRAENSSIVARALQSGARAMFQCSSASRKFLNATD